MTTSLSLQAIIPSFLFWKIAAGRRMHFLKFVPKRIVGRNGRLIYLKSPSGSRRYFPKTIPTYRVYIIFEKDIKTIPTSMYGLGNDKTTYY